MRSPSVNIFGLAFLAVFSTTAPTATSAASVFLPASLSARTAPSDVDVRSMRTRYDLASARRRRVTPSKNGRSDNPLPLAMAIPGYGLTEQIFVGGFANFLSIYNVVITARILLSWFPQAAGIGALQPVYAITDPYLNLFRGIIPPVFGLDLSPLIAFFVLNVLSSTTAAIGCEIPAAGAAALNGKKKKKGMIVFGRRFA